MVINNIYISEGDVFDGHPVDLLDEIEMDDQLKLYASVWEVDKNGEMVRTKDGKVVFGDAHETTRKST